MTGTDRQYIAGEEDVSDSKRYQAVSRVRDRLEELERDIEVLEEHHPDLLAELREVVCDTSYYCPRCGESFDRPSDAHQHALHQSYQDEKHAGYDKDEVPNRWPLFDEEE